jgi:ferredoxin, 2Fe-2S
MVTVTFIESSGKEKTVESPEGSTLMEAAVKNGVGGILAECGGACTCATCHVYVDEAWADKVGGASGDEEEMLTLAIDPQPSSRLSCQISLNAELDGLVVRVPVAQF